MFPYQYQSRGFPARRQPQQPYSELDAYAEDLEYQVYAPAPVYERAPRYQRPVYREPVYAPREPEYRGYPTDYYEDYAPEPVYADASYEYDDAYEYPEPARPAPRPVSYYAPPPAPAPRRIAAPEYFEAPVVEVAPRARQVAPRPRALPAPAPRPQTPSPQEAKLDQIIDLLKDTLKQKQRSAPAPAAAPAPAPRPRAPSRPQSQHASRVLSS
ncbi:hypothetical protein DL93DRAFT_765745 [Clavulina sp. PMI_390]|nr:hypothetical protein DL93DRAFT_765745 [Clavulina sp. PMI_390]